MIELAIDDDGWPIWPPNAPAIWESLQRGWLTGHWGKYDSPMQADCVATVAKAMTLSGECVAVLPASWLVYVDRMRRSPQVRLCSSGTAAIELSLRCCGIGPGDEVVVAAYDYPGNFRTIELLGATPVLADVRPNGVTMDPQSLRQIEGDDVKAVLVSHLYGELADVLAIREVCDQRNWKLIEDACQVPGAGWKVNNNFGEDCFIPVGCLADVATLSFGGSKLLSAGNGGAILVRDQRSAARLQAYLDRPSDTSPLSALQCAVLTPQWAMLDELNRRRSLMANALRDLDWQHLGASVLAENLLEQRSAHYKFALLADSSIGGPELLRRLTHAGIPAGKGFRSMHGTSDRRSRKPVALGHAQRLGEVCVVIDQRVLLSDDFRCIRSRLLASMEEAR